MVAERGGTARPLIPVHSLRVRGLGVLSEVDAGRLVLGERIRAHNQRPLVTLTAGRRQVSWI